MKICLSVVVKVIKIIVFNDGVEAAMRGRGNMRREIDRNEERRGKNGQG